MKGGEGSCGKEAHARGLIYLFLTCGGALDNVVTPPHNHHTSSMRIKPPLEVAFLCTFISVASIGNEILEKLFFPSI